MSKPRATNLLNKDIYLSISRNGGFMMENFLSGVSIFTRMIYKDIQEFFKDSFMN